MEAKLASENASLKFRWVIKNISDKQMETSPEFWLRDFPWKLEFRKTTAERERMVKIFLLRTNGKKDDQLKCMALAKIQLIPFEDDVEPLEQSITAYEFGAANEQSANVSLITLNDLNDAAKKYVKDDAICLEIEVITDAVQRIQPNRLTQLQVVENDNDKIKCMLTVREIDEVVGAMSPMFPLCNTMWEICAFRNGQFLDIYLRPIGKRPMQHDYNVNAKIKLRPHNAAFLSYDRELKGKIDINDHSLIMKKFIEWDFLVDPVNSYFDNASIQLEFEIYAVLGQNEPNDIGFNCIICLESFVTRDTISLKCGHIFCRDCVDKAVRPRKSCPLCNTKVLPTQLRKIYLNVTP